MNWFVDDYSRTQILITDGVREFYIPKFRLAMDIDGDVVYLYWNDRERGTGGDERILPLNYLDVVDNYSGYISNPTSATDLAAQIDAMIDSAWTDITAGGGDLLTAKADLLSHDGVSDTILPGGTNEYILSRNDVEQTGLEWIPKTDIYSDELAQDAVGSILDTDEFTYNDGAPSIALKNVFSYLIGSTGNVDTTATAAEEILYSVLIPGGTLAVGDSIVCTSFHKKSSGAGTQTARVRLHTANAIGGTTYYGTTFGGTNGFNAQFRIVITGASAQAGSFGLFGVSGTDYVTSALAIASDMYVLMTSQKSVAGDGAHLRMGTVEILKKR